MMQNQPSGPQKPLPLLLRWPWVVLVYLALFALLRLWAIPAVLAVGALQKKYSPHGAAEGYCLSRTRKKLNQLPIGILMLFVAVCVGVYALYGELDALYKQLLAGVMAAGLLALGGYVSFAAVRDSFFPAGSQLARSIRSQLPYPDEAPEVDELFRMVDADLGDDPLWVGSIGIGKEWVLGDSASLISRIRGIFTIDRIEHHRRSNGGSTTTRILELVLVDDRWNQAVTDFKSPQDLQNAADCLAGRVPEARRGGGSARAAFCGMKEEEREAFLQEFDRRQAARLASAPPRFDGVPQSGGFGGF